MLAVHAMLPLGVFLIMRKWGQSCFFFRKWVQNCAPGSPDEVVVGLAQCWGGVGGGVEVCMQGVHAPMLLAYGCSHALLVVGHAICT